MGRASAATTSPLRVVQAMGLPFEDFASNPTAVYQHRKNAEEALRNVIGYRVFQDLRRGWRVSAPNLEQTGLLRIAYESLDEIAADDALWRDRHSVVAGATAEERRAACKAVLDYFRRELAIKTRYLDPASQDAMQECGLPEPEGALAIEEDEDAGDEPGRPPGDGGCPGAGISGADHPAHRARQVPQPPAESGPASERRPSTKRSSTSSPRTCSTCSVSPVSSKPLARTAS